MLRAKFCGGYVRPAVAGVLTFCLAAGGAEGAWIPSAGADDDDVETLCLTILHNNDAESQLLNAGSGLEDFGGADRFVTVVRQEQRDAWRNGCAYFLRGHDDDDGIERVVVTVSSGDNFLAGPEFNASLEKAIPFFDSIVVDKVGYDAVAIGNHEFDFGPDVLADFIEGVARRKTKFLSANLDFSQEPRLQDLVNRRRIAASKIVRKGDERIGIVGATTEDLRFISSPGDVIVNAVLPAVQAEIDWLESDGVNTIILISHLQSINEDLALLSMLKGVDVAIAGGGDEVLANPGDLLVPGDEGNIFGRYPLTGFDAGGNEIPVVTTPGNYKYVGRLEVQFNESGEVLDTIGGLVRVAGGNNPDAVSGNPFIIKNVIEPVESSIAALAANVIGTSEVGLNGVRADVRTKETNLGNLIADSLLEQATQLVADFGAPVPDVALQNGGGIRNDDVRGPGDITELDTFDILPFTNFVTIVPNIPRSQFKEILENAVSRVEFTDGRFAQVAGFSFEFSVSGNTAQVLNPDGTVATPGTRVREVVLDDGTIIVSGGDVQNPTDTLTVATIDFLARGGDQYPFRGAPFTTVGVTYQQALLSYIVDVLGGSITAAQYPEGGEGRITRLN